MSWDVPLIFFSSSIGSSSSASSQPPEANDDNEIRFTLPQDNYYPYPYPGEGEVEGPARPPQISQLQNGPVRNVLIILK